MKTKPKKIQSLKSKSLIAFALLSVSFIVLIWLFQAIFFSTIYQNTKKSEIKSILNDTISNFKSDETYETYIQNLSLQNNASILIFSEQNGVIDVIYNTSRESKEENVIRNINTIMLNIKDTSETSFLNDVNKQKDLKLLSSCEMKIIDGKNYYFTVTSPITPLSSVTDTFYLLLVFISIGVLCLTLIGSYILSNQLSRPIISIARQAKKITSSQNVKFNSNEYTEVQELSNTLNYAISELQKTDKIRKEVLANVSHELKTPLTMIKSYTELIKDISGNDPLRRQEHLDVIYSEANRLEMLLNDMMDYSKLESGIMSYNKTKVNLSDALRRLYSIYQEKYTKFIFNITLPEDDVFIYADQARIEQVIINLLNNAINYSKDKFEITIILSPCTNNNFKLEIIDQGIGISEENLKHIFDRHFRTNSAKRATVGSGIGLSIVKSILNDHGFSFGVTSTETVGSNFYVVFSTLIKEGDK